MSVNTLFDNCFGKRTSFERNRFSRPALNITNSALRILGSTNATVLGEGGFLHYESERAIIPRRIGEHKSRHVSFGFSANWHCPFSSLWQLDNVLMQISAYSCQNEEYDNAAVEMVFMWRRWHPSTNIVHKNIVWCSFFNLFLTVVSKEPEELCLVLFSSLSNLRCITKQME